MKAVMLSIRPKWCNKISSGEKTIEVRKSRPKMETPFKCYIYCTAPKKFHMISEHMATSSEYLHLCDGKATMSDGFEFFGREDYEVINRKVIGEFVCDQIYQYSTGNVDGQTISSEEMQKQSCLTDKELCNYETSSEPKENCIYLIGLYGWHISALQIYDEPRELGEFNLSRAPMSWCYCEESEEK